eukprot:scaffold2.g7160.t1
MALDEQQMNDYELERQRRLEANRKRLEELGIQKMVDDLHAAHAADKPAKRQRREKPAALPHELEPTRRSKRMEGREQPNYRLIEERASPSERRPTGGPLVKEGEMPEVYTRAHVRALGSTDKEWVMFQDGYNNQGERIYDSEKGVSCHQCRQKTLGQHTTCSKCKSGLGSLCGDCLFARYGEHVEEVNANPNWVCPSCRDICNCSRHRKMRKWEATGQLHHRVKSRGYASVAHYLVLNKLGSAAAKRAALETGFCPPDLEEKLHKEIEEAGDEPDEEEAAAAQPEQQQQGGGAAPAEGEQGEAAAHQKKKRKRGPRRKKDAQAEQQQQQQKEGSGPAAAAGAKTAKGKAAKGAGAKAGAKAAPQGSAKPAGQRGAKRAAAAAGGGKKKKQVAN